MSLTIEEQACNNTTWRHIHKVYSYLNRCVKDLIDRGEKHDQSKLEEPEVTLFTEYTPKLANCTYGSEEYNRCFWICYYQGFLGAIKPALDHHYANNRHHPEFHKNGIDDMNLLDLVEMVCDWKAASERHDNGNIRKSVEVNADRFGMSPQLVKIIENTVEYLFKE